MDIISVRYVNVFDSNILSARFLIRMLLLVQELYHGYCTSCYMVGCLLGVPLVIGRSINVKSAKSSCGEYKDEGTRQQRPVYVQGLDGRD